ncbi:MAG: 4Fe-4S binding protein [Oligoflexia bacterium]|nr:4Fe-4S binding protein [Oligoflexia bacterium]
MNGKITRTIIKIDNDLCNGCGQCVVGCSEGALQIIEGKAKLVKENFCDGFGDCVGTCPTGALTVEKRECADFDEKATKDHLLKTQGIEAVKRMEEAQKRHQHNQHNHHNHSHHNHHHASGGGGCPGSKMMEFNREKTASATILQNMPNVIPSELTQWPVQLHLVPTNAPFFNDREMVILSTCSPIASADTHWRYLRGRSVVVACPKLDKTEPYANKLAQIFSENNIPKVIIVRMIVPCCGGLSQIAQEAREISGRSDLILEEHLISIEDGSVKSINLL